MTYKELVTMLRGSPGGTTEAMFMSHGATLAQLSRLVAEGEAHTVVRRLASHGGMSVIWYFPTTSAPSQST